MQELESKPAERRGSPPAAGFCRAASGSQPACSSPTVPAEQQPEQAPGPRYSSAGEIYLRNPRLPAPSLITESIKSNWGGGERQRKQSVFSDSFRSSTNCCCRSSTCCAELEHVTKRQSPARFLSGLTLLGPNEAGAMGCSTSSTRPRRPGSLQTPA